MTARLVQMAFAPFAAVAAWLVALGLEVRWDPARTQIDCTNPPLGLSGALWTGLGPLERAEVLGFVLAGQWWPQVFPGLLEACEREEKRRANICR